MKIKIVLVDDHNLFREGLKLILSKNANFELIADFSNGKDFLKGLTQLESDIVLMDIEMPEINGIESTKAAIKQNKNLKIIALSMHTDESMYAEMIKAGVKGYLSKDMNSKRLFEAIETVHKGENYFSTAMLNDIFIKLHEKKIDPPKDKPKFSAKELETIKLICKGLSNQEIAEKMKVSVKTVESYKTKLMQKIDTKNSAGIILYAIKNKLVAI